MIDLLVTVIVAGLIFYLFWWFIGFVGLPEPFNKVARVIVGLVALLFLLSLLGGMVSVPALRL